MLTSNTLFCCSQFRCPGQCRTCRDLGACKPSLASSLLLFSCEAFVDNAHLWKGDFAAVTRQLGISILVWRDECMLLLCSTHLSQNEKGDSGGIQKQEKKTLLDLVFFGATCFASCWGEVPPVTNKKGDPLRTVVFNVTGSTVKGGII